MYLGTEKLNLVELRELFLAHYNYKEHKIKRISMI